MLISLLMLSSCLAGCSGSENDNSSADNASHGKLSDSKIVDLSQFNLKDYRNKILILDFWATWCGPCRKQMPVLHAFYQELIDEGCLEIVAINLGESRAKVESFVQRYPMPYTIVLDQGRQLGKMYGVRSIPTLVVLDESGTVIQSRSGYSPILGTYLKNLLHTRTPDCVPSA
jgi:thiol-disulfide isomerase/thioredoxin